MSHGIQTPPVALPAPMDKTQISQAMLIVWSCLSAAGFNLIRVVGDGGGKWKFDSQVGS